MKKICKVYLNIDFDFFVKEDPTWDFQHAETAFHTDILWGLRASSMLLNGVDLIKQMSVDNQNPTPGQFIAALKTLPFTYDKPKFIVAESHAYAFKGYKKAHDLVINFDAHHDLGYHSASKLRQWAAEGKWEAGSWLGSLLRQTADLEAMIVYPPWRSYSEWREYRKSENSTDSLHARVDVIVWQGSELFTYDLLERYGASTKFVVDSVFVCRSGAWVPPWNDMQFSMFVDDLSRVISTEPTVIKHPRDPLKIREFNVEEIRAAAAEMLGMLNQPKENK
jgi:hypothetical protein